MINPEELTYHREHCWVRIEGNKATIGITDYAQDSLGDIVFLEMPEAGLEVSIDEEIGDIESTKTTSPLVSPLSGKIIEVNEELKESPGLINEDPYGKGWIAILEVSDQVEIENLMDAKEYKAFIQEEGL